MKTRTVTATALMAALVFAGTYFFKIPSPFGGYAHLGDCMIILGVCVLGMTRGMLAAAIGAGLAAVSYTHLDVYKRQGLYRVNPIPSGK